MRVGVIGLGAIGGCVSSRLLSQPGGDTVALAAGRHAEAVRLHGIGDRERRQPVPLVGATLPEAGAPYDLLLLCTRTDATAQALAPALPLLAPDGAVVCLQNGLPEEAAARLAGPARVLGAVIGWSASASFSPRPEAWTTGGGRFTLGAFSPAGAANVPRAAALLGRAFPVRVTDNLAGARWSKLAMNCAMSTLGAVSGLDLGQLAARADAREAALRVMAEVIAVGRARGVSFEPIAGVRPDLLLRLPRAAQHAAVWLAARRRPRQKSGMLVRLLEGRTAGQVDDLNGLVVRLQRELPAGPGASSGSAPLNERLVALVHAIERGEQRISPDHLAGLLA